MGEPAELLAKLHLKFDLSPGSLTAVIDGTRGPIEVPFQKLLEVIERDHSTDNKSSHEFRKASAQAILFCFKRDEANSRGGSNRDCCIYISEQEQRTINIWWSDGVKGTLRMLSGVFEEILTVNKRKISILATDFCQKLNHDSIDVDGALKDPLFWSASDNISFFKSIYEKYHSKLRNKVIFKTHDEHFTYGNKIRGQDNRGHEVEWREALELDDEEIKRLREKIDVSDDIIVEKNTIVDIAGGNRHSKEEYGNELYHFLRFFRNIHAHFNKQAVEVQHCFKNAEDGYWNFFYIRFPGLLCQITKDYIDHATVKDPVEPKFLPNLK